MLPDSCTASSCCTEGDSFSDSVSILHMDGQYVVITRCHRLSVQNSDGRSERRQLTCMCVCSRGRKGRQNGTVSEKAASVSCILSDPITSTGVNAPKTHRGLIWDPVNQTTFGGGHPCHVSLATLKDQLLNWRLSIFILAPHRQRKCPLFLLFRWCESFPARISLQIICALPFQL